MRSIRLLVVLSLVTLLSVYGYSQESQRTWNFNIGGGPGFPLGNLSNFADTGGHFVVGGGYNFTKNIGVNSEFMWHDLPLNSTTRQFLHTPGASARQYSFTINPILRIPLGSRAGAYAIGGGGWYHRSAETTTPGAGVVCNPYWSWWYGCAIGSVDFVTGSTSADAFGGNIGGGLTLRIGESGAKIYTEVRYHHAGYNKISTDVLPLTFGLRW